MHPESFKKPGCERIIIFFNILHTKNISAAKSHFLAFHTSKQEAISGATQQLKAIH